jgi:hypothetical protein
MQSKPQDPAQIIIWFHPEREIGQSAENQTVPDQIRIQCLDRQSQHPQLHGKVLQAISSSHGNNVTVYDTHGTTEITPDKLPRSQEAWAKSFHMKIVTNTRNLNAIIMVGHQLAMSISLSEMKQGIQTILRQVDGFVKYNAWNEHLDSRVAGYTANLHPAVHHNREKVQTDISNFLGDMDENQWRPPRLLQFQSGSLPCRQQQVQQESIVQIPGD